VKHDIQLTPLGGIFFGAICSLPFWALLIAVYFKWVK